ncbi:MAG TPA: cytochrome c3 family protein [Dissulfurispiraceae bacterium]|nr:cytochrome c3 family protein [Dissulfurispiraceae bacterium]
MGIKTLFEKIDCLLRYPITFSRIVAAFVIVTILAVAGVVGARMILVPSFTAANDDYRYQWHRVANEEEWKTVAVKHQGNSYCKGCHADQHKNVAASAHAKVECENCHGPAFNHPDKPEKLVVDKSRELCLRCHASLPYRTPKYNEIPKGPMNLKMVDTEAHNTGMECVTCHDAHKASFK